jgi:hypothetical protein
LAEAIVEGMVKGLAAGVGDVAKGAKNLAESALSSVGSFLGISSPSKEFFKMGAWSAEGMANGIDENADMVSKSSTNMGKAAIASMSKTLSTLSDVVQGNMNVNPTITPVLDLSNVKTGASQIGSMLAVKPVSVDTSFTQATTLSAGVSPTTATTDQSVAPSNSSSGVTFNQYNSSPKALTSAEIYRLTKNQLSVARGYYVFEDGSSG